MNKKLRKFYMFLAAVVMVILSVFIGNGRANEVNKSEAIPGGANAASREAEAMELTSEDLGVLGDYLYDDATALDATSTDAAEPSDEVQEILDGMTVEEKVAQLFIITPDALTGTEMVTMAGDATKDAIDEIPVGGIIYMGDNLQTEYQVKEMLANTNS